MSDAMLRRWWTPGAAAIPAEAGTAGHLGGLDGLRAIACATVFLENFHHSMGMTVSGRLGPFDFAYLAESGLGVATFIVLSGSLLSIPFWSDLALGRNTFRLGPFALKRAVRIVPPYYLCLIALLMVMHGSHGMLDSATHFLFVNNLRERSFYSLGPQYWTIGLFVQFYCLLPFVFWGIRTSRCRGWWACAFLIAASAATYGLHVWLMSTRDRWLVWPLSALATPNGFVLDHSTLAHMPLFLLGIVAGYPLMRLSRPVTDRPAASVTCELLFWLSAAGLAALAAMPAAQHLELPYSRYTYPWMPGLAALAVATVPFAPIARRLLEFWPIRSLGVISYGFYIYHVACMQVVRRLFSTADFRTAPAKAQFAAMSIGLTIAVAAASYLLVERPLLRWSHRRAVS